MTRMPLDAKRPVIESEAMANAMAHVPTSVAAVTAISANKEPIGMVVGSFAFVSIDPPLVLFMPAKTSSTFNALRDAHHFTVNVLAHDQEGLSRQLQRPSSERLEAIDWRPSSNGSPVLPDVVSAIDCEFDRVIDAGDHFIALGSVQHLEVHRRVAPLIFFQRGYGGFTPGAFMEPAEGQLARDVSRVAMVRQTLERFAAELDADVSVFARIGEHAVAVASISGGDAESTVVGSRYPIMAPLGALFVAWESEAEIERWSDKLRHMPDETRRELRRQLEAVQERGWTYALNSMEPDADLGAILRIYGVENVTPADQREMEDAVRRALPNYTNRSFVAGESVALGNIVAPICDSEGTVRMTVRLAGFDRAVRPDEIERLAARLTEVAREVSGVMFAD